jgi:hypothetical protein
MSAAGQHKEKIICMLESINDEKFLNQMVFQKCYQLFIMCIGLEVFTHSSRYFLMMWRAEHKQTFAMEIISETAKPLAVGVLYLTGRECDSGSSIDFRVK